MFTLRLIIPANVLTAAARQACVCVTYQPGPVGGAERRGGGCIPAFEILTHLRLRCSCLPALNTFKFNLQLHLNVFKSRVCEVNVAYSSTLLGGGLE